MIRIECGQADLLFIRANSTYLVVRTLEMCAGSTMTNASAKEVVGKNRLATQIDH